ncbi:MAG: aminotransferase class IV [Planctomycetota bacterium]|nr:aminotransferase class IV [Planctomycetota bacterium]
MIVHLNGELVDAAEAHVSVFDRGFLFGDGVYEGLRATEGHIIGLALHVERMRAGLEEVRIRGFDPESIGSMSAALLDANVLGDAFVYWQVTRGAPEPGAPVRQRIPGEARTTVFGYAAPLPALDQCRTPAIRTASLQPDLRWLRGRVKATSLLGSVLAAIEADEAGCEDAIMHRDGVISEATAANVLISAGEEIATPELDGPPILDGVTRRLLLKEAPEIVVRPITVDELRGADEVMLCGTTTLVTSVTSLDGRPIGRFGAERWPGPVSQRMLDALLTAIERERKESRVHSAS